MIDRTSLPKDFPDQIVSRFAPSPSGPLHLGHAYSALTAYDMCQELGGTFLVRIEDIDHTRCRPEYEQQILSDLRWLNIHWFDPPRRQSDHIQDYQAALTKLKDLNLVYPCFCTRKEIAAEIANAARAPHGPDGPLYPGTCRALSQENRQSRLASGDGHAWRLDLSAALAHVGSELSWHDVKVGRVSADPGLFGDIVVARKDIATSYHLAVVHDDALQGINLITRGQDLFQATHIHRLLQALLGLPVPFYYHHDLVTDDAGKRLAKRDQAESLEQWRARGFDLAALRRHLNLLRP